jgi:hypothetical protein
VYSINSQVELVFLSVGGLDDPSVFEPEVDFWVSSAQSWVKVDCDVRKCDTQPTVEELANRSAGDG